MAKAEIFTVPPVVPERFVKLELTIAEAEVLAQVCRFIAGPERGPRGLMDNIQVALLNAGVDRLLVEPRGEITFS